MFNGQREEAQRGDRILGYRYNGENIRVQWLKLFIFYFLDNLALMILDWRYRTPEIRFLPYDFFSKKTSDSLFFWCLVLGLSQKQMDINLLKCRE